MTLQNFINIGALLVVITLFVAESMNSQIDNIYKKDFKKLIKFVIILVVSSIISFLMIKSDIMEAQGINELNVYSQVLFCLGMGLFTAGSYDKAKRIVSNYKRK